MIALGIVAYLAVGVLLSRVVGKRILESWGHPVDKNDLGILVLIAVLWPVMIPTGFLLYERDGFKGPGLLDRLFGIKEDSK